MTDLPVIGVPMKTSDLGGLDSLLSTVQMPSGVPVATVAINGARNAAILAAKILRVAGLAAPAGGAALGSRQGGRADDRALLHSRAWRPSGPTRRACPPGWRSRWRCARRGPGWARSPSRRWRTSSVKASFDVQRVAEIEEVTQHDVIAFVSCVAENVGDASKYLHYGLTSSDVLDTGLALQLQAAGALLEEETIRLGQILQRRAEEHRDTIMIGRTHGVHAEPITFGMVLGLWAFEIKRGLERLREATRQVSVGKISGAVGTYANVDPQVEEITMDRLGLEAAPISTQIVQRDRHAHFMSALALLASTSGEDRRCKCATTSAPRCWRPRSTSLRARRARRPCRTSATRSSPSASAARPG